MELEPKLITANSSSNYDRISPDHKQYLVNKHKTWKLDPLPTENDDDPLNWSNRYKNIELIMVAFHGFFSTFMASGQVPAFEPLAEQLEKSIKDTSYLTSSQIIILGWMPWIWLPLMNRYGRHQLLMISCLGSMVFNLISVFCTSYTSLMIMRCLVAIFIAPGIAVGGAIVGETTFAHQRASRNGIWTLLVTIGTIAGPIFMGLVIERVATKFIFVIFTVTNFIQFICYLFFGKETLYNYKDLSKNNKKIWNFSPIIPENTISLKVILKPGKLLFNWKIVLIAIAYGVVFTYANIATNVDLPVIFVHKFDMGPQAIGLQFIAFLIGMVLGEQVGGWISDRWMTRARNNYKGPQYRLWLAYPGFITSIIGLIVFGLQVENLQQYNITPLIGLVISSFGLQLITTTLISYGIDITSKPSDVALFMTAIRQSFAFSGPFYFPPMFDTLGYAGTFGLLAGLIAGFGWIPILFIHWLCNRKDNKILQPAPVKVIDSDGKK